MAGLQERASHKNVCVAELVNEWERRPKFRIDQTVITLSSLVISKLMRANGHYVAREVFCLLWNVCEEKSS